jgi:phosphopentomutase
VNALQRAFERVIWIVLDSVGIGAMPDAADYGDAGSDTLGNIAKGRQLDLPNLRKLGLGNIKPIDGMPAVEHPAGAYGKCTLGSPGKETITGHWEMAGILLKKPFPVYPHGFPPEIIEAFEARIGAKLSATNQHPEPRSSKNSAKNICELAGRLSTRRLTASFRLQRTSG